MTTVAQLIGVLAYLLKESDLDEHAEVRVAPFDGHDPERIQMVREARILATVEEHDGVIYITSGVRVP